MAQISFRDGKTKARTAISIYQPLHDRYELLEPLHTAVGRRTMAVDAATGRLHVAAPTRVPISALAPGRNTVRHAQAAGVRANRLIP
jgi:hypothetical protein